MSLTTSRGMPRNWFSCCRRKLTWKLGLMASRTRSSVLRSAFFRPEKKAAALGRKRGLDAHVASAGVEEGAGPGEERAGLHVDLDALVHLGAQPQPPRIVVGPLVAARYDVPAREQPQDLVSEATSCALPGCCAYVPPFSSSKSSTASRKLSTHGRCGRGARLSHMPSSCSWQWLATGCCSSFR